MFLTRVYFVHQRFMEVEILTKNEAIPLNTPALLIHQ